MCSFNQYLSSVYYALDTYEEFYLYYFYFVSYYKLNLQKLFPPAKSDTLKNM